MGPEESPEFYERFIQRLKEAYVADRIKVSVILLPLYELMHLLLIMLVKNGEICFLDLSTFIFGDLKVPNLFCSVAENWLLRFS